METYSIIIFQVQIKDRTKVLPFFKTKYSSRELNIYLFLICCSHEINLKNGAWKNSIKKV